jgi:hypothetical protein
MKRRFIIGIDSLDTDQEKRFREFIADYGGLWWHWIGNMWLMTTDNDEVSAAKICDFVLGLKGYARVVVFEVPEDADWAASSNKNRSGKRIYDWLKTTWNGE